jgi:frataxin-like iron-binding protein CyaY
MDYRKLNATTIIEAFPLPFMDGILNMIVGNEMYMILDKFSGYNQIWIVKEVQEKNHLPYQMGHLRGSRYNVQIKDSPNYIHLGNLQRIHP